MRNPEEMFPIVEDWSESGLTQKDYSHHHGIPAHILSYWVCRYRRSQEGTDENNTGFTELKMGTPTPTAGAIPSKNIELILPNGIMMSIPASSLTQLSPSHLHRLLQLCSD